jgi:two-component sensor histidine kinase
LTKETADFVERNLGIQYTTVSGGDEFFILEKSFEEKEMLLKKIHHAFPPGVTGSVRIGLSSDEDGKFTLVISDNGVGLPAHVDSAHAETLGMELVNTLVGQLKGKIEIVRNSGTEFGISF